MTVPANQVGLVQNNRNSAAGFQPGQSGNPGGRPKGVAAYVRNLTLEGTALIDRVWDILQNPAGKPYQRQKTQLECIQLLMDRGWGKAIQSVEHSGTIGGNLNAFADMSDDDLQALVLAYRVIRDAKAGVIEGEMRAIEASEDADCDTGQAADSRQ